MKNPIEQMSENLSLKNMFEQPSQSIKEFCFKKRRKSN